MKEFIFSCVLFLCLLLPNLIQATELSEGDIYLAQADTLMKDKAYPAAAKDLQMAWDYFSKEKVATGLAKCYKRLLYCWMKEKKFSEMIEFGESVATEIKDYESSEPALFARGHIYLSYACLKTSQGAARLTHYEKAIDLFELGGIRNRHLSSCYLNAAQIYLRKIDYTKAKTYLYLALERDPEKRYEAEIYSQLANCHFWMKEYEEALVFCNKGLPIARKPTVIGAYHAITAGIYRHFGELEEAKQEVREALASFNQVPKDYESRIRMNSVLSQIAFEQEDFKNGEQFFAKGIAELKAPGVPPNREGAGLYVEHARSFLKRGQINTALPFFQQALAQLFPNIDTTDLSSNPPSSELYPEAWLMTTLLEKAKAFTQRYEQSQQIKDLQIAKNCFELTLATIDELRKIYGTETSKILIGEYGQECIEAAIENAYRIFQLTKEQSALKNMFALMKTSRANILNEALQKNKAILLSTVPEAVLQEEKNARADIASQRKAIITAKLQAPIDPEISANILPKLEQELVQKELEYHDLLTEIKNTHPAFATLYNQSNTFDANQLQKTFLSAQSGILSFYIGQENCYVVLLEKEKLSTIRLPEVEVMEKKLAQYLALLKEPNTFSQSPQAALQLGHQLYQDLGLAELLANKALNHLIVLPDGLLNSLPFEALVLEPSGTFFLETYTTQYLPSLALLESNRPSDMQAKALVCFCPQFSDGSRGFIRLNCAAEEIRRLRNINIFSGEKARLATLKEWAPRSRLLHLSTHAQASGGTPSIELADTTCYLPDIYALDLSAELVVLSACETNLGTVKKGEGVFSLARGFFHSGAQSLVSSQWQVNERTTADILNYFYQELQAGQTKAQALRAAKLRFLRVAERDVYRAPFYWAGLTFIGADGQMDLSTSWWSPRWLALLGLIFAFGVATRFFTKRA